MSAIFSEIRERIESVSRILVLCHDRPDGDAIGSAVALASILKKLGKDTTVINADRVPESLAFLPLSDWVVSPEEGRTKASEAELVIALDSAGKDRIGQAVWDVVPAVPLINIDHHISNTEYGDVNYVDSIAPATGQILFALAEACGWAMDADIGTLLYAAISTDTGSFRYPSTTAETMRIGGRLLDMGVDAGEVNQQLYENYPRRRVEVLRLLLQGLRFDCDGKYASVRLPLETTNELALKPGDTEGVIDVIRSVDSVVISVFYEELANGKIRVSSRSKDPAFSVGEICSVFGGGGHTLAAGARMKGPLEEAEEKFLAQVRKVLS